MKISKSTLENNISIEIIENNALNQYKQWYYVPERADSEHIRTLYENGLLKIRLHQKQTS